MSYYLYLNFNIVAFTHSSINLLLNRLFTDSIAPSSRYLSIKISIKECLSSVFVMNWKDECKVSSDGAVTSCLRGSRGRHTPEFDTNLESRLLSINNTCFEVKIWFFSPRFSFLCSSSTDFNCSIMSFSHSGKFKDLDQSDPFRTFYLFIYCGGGGGICSQSKYRHILKLPAFKTY